MRLGKAAEKANMATAPALNCIPILSDLEAVSRKKLISVGLLGWL